MHGYILQPRWDVRRCLVDVLRDAWEEYLRISRVERGLHPYRVEVPKTPGCGWPTRSERVMISAGLRHSSAGLAGRGGGHLPVDAPRERGGSAAHVEQVGSAAPAASAGDIVLLILSPLPAG